MTSRRACNRPVDETNFVAVRLSADGRAALEPSALVVWAAG